MKKKDIIYILLTAFFFVFLLKNGLSEWFLSYDESGQFYISKGLCHYSNPYSPYSGIGDVLKYNKYFNMDPGGFSVVLHFWSKISNSYIWLRLLPLLFYLLALYFSYKSLIISGCKRSYSLLLISLFLVTDPFVSVSCQLRAYTMEMFGIAISLWFLVKYNKMFTEARLFLLSVILCIFLTTRYDFIIYTFAFSIILFLHECQFKRTLFQVKPFFVYSGLLFIATLIIYLGQMHTQNSHAIPLYYLGYIGNKPELLLSNMSIRFYVLLLFYVFRRKEHQGKNIILNLCLLTNIVFFVLSIINKYPWDEQRTFAVTYFQYLTIGYCFIKYCDSHRWKIIPHLVFLGFIIYNVYSINFYKRHNPEYYIFEEFEDIYSKLPKGQTIFVHENQLPNIKYQYEEGIHKNDHDRNYYKNIVFSLGASHAKTNLLFVGDGIPLDSAKCNYYLIVGKPDSTYKRLPPYKFIYTQK